MWFQVGRVGERYSLDRVYWSPEVLFSTTSLGDYDYRPMVPGRRESITSSPSSPNFRGFLESKVKHARKISGLSYYSPPFPCLTVVGRERGAGTSSKVPGPFELLCTYTSADTIVYESVCPVGVCVHGGEFGT